MPVIAVGQGQAGGPTCEGNHMCGDACCDPVSAYQSAIPAAVPNQATPLPLSAVRLTGGPLKNAQDITADYLLSLEIDRMMAGYRMRAGLEPKAKPYGGWDSVEGKQLTGHIGGHYLSAMALMYAATGQEVFKQRGDLLVEEFAEVQQARGNGYLGANADSNNTDGMLLMAQVANGDIRSGGFDLNGLWAPWYTYHKTYAGLRDAYRLLGNQKALELEIGFAQWAEDTLGGLNDEQLQKMLACEFGGMPEVLVDLYADTGDEKWLNLSRKFDHDVILNPLYDGQDRLSGTHANTQVPKLLGTAARYKYTGDEPDGDVTEYFWGRVVHHHSYATGGHGKDEYFGPPDQISLRIDGRTAETCNVYNMLKLTRKLFAFEPTPEYAAFQERALFNHILGAIDHETAQTTYMVPVGQDVQREYQDMQNGFTCCVGSGMESHALHGDGVYYVAPPKVRRADAVGSIWVTQFVPSIATWKQAGVVVEQKTDFPLGDSSQLVISFKEDAADALPTKYFTLYVRKPVWAGDGFAIEVNGQPIEMKISDGLSDAYGAFVPVTRTWQDGDEVSLSIPKSLTVEPTPDDPHVAALMWGPLVLAGDLGPELPYGKPREATIPTLVAFDTPIETWLKPIEGEIGWFETVEIAEPNEVKLTPFYRIGRRSYMAYFDLLTPEQWEVESERILAEQARLKELQKITIAYTKIGEQQPEQDHGIQMENSWPVRTRGRAGRRGHGWFAMNLPLANAKPADELALMVTYFNGTEDNWGGAASEFKVIVEGVVLEEHRLEEEQDSKKAVFYEKTYAIPAELVNEDGTLKKSLNIRFEGVNRGQAGPVYGIRVIKQN